jgi:hypothetical protein
MVNRAGACRPRRSTLIEMRQREGTEATPREVRRCGFV